MKNPKSAASAPQRKTAPRIRIHEANRPAPVKHGKAPLPGSKRLNSRSIGMR
jgi:hypothetical protein